MAAAWMSVLVVMAVVNVAEGGKCRAVETTIPPSNLASDNISIDDTSECFGPRGKTKLVCKKTSWTPGRRLLFLLKDVR